MRRFFSILGLLFVGLALWVLPASAQNPEWEAYMYNSDNGRMLLIGSDNVVYDDFTLPGLQNHDYSWQVMVSPNGEIVVYSLANRQTQVQIIQAYSTVSDSLIGTYNIPSQQGQLVDNSINLNATTQAFSFDSRQVAIGYTIEDQWSLIVMDLANQPGTLLLQLNSSDPSMASVQRLGFDVPTVMRFDGATIDFEIIPTATGGAFSYPHYSYNIPNQTLTQNYYLTVPGGDFSDSTGQYVFAISDYRLPNSNDTYTGYGQQVNALHIWTPATTETYPIFNAPNRSVSRPVFIQNSEKILFTTYDWITSANESTVLEPNSSNPTLVTTLQNVFPSGIEGTGNGFLISISTNDVANVFPELQNLPDRIALLSFDTRIANNGTSVKQVWISEANANYKLVWARDNQLTARPLPPAWIPIGDAVDASNYDSLTQSGGASQPPVNTGSLQIGGQARIFTTQGDRANMRSGPGTNFEVVEQLANDTIVTVLEGPQSSANFTWWRVQTGSNTGWVVESADSVRVLQPFGTVPTPVPTPIPASSVGTFQRGDRVLVTEAGNNLNARQQPSTNASVVVILKTNQIFPIIGGPVTTEGYTWWQIDTSVGAGWVAEGDGTDDWIVNANG